MKKELVSIITPMYKGAALVGKTIDSVLAQTYPNWEMIIVDDCSPDNGEGIAVVKAHAKDDPRIRLIESKQNRGSSGSRNIALKEAKGRFVAFLDSDDIWNEDFLERQLAFMESKDAPLVFSSYYRIDEFTEEELLKPFIVPDKVSYRSLLKTCPIFPSTAIYDTAKTPKIYFNENLGSMRDDYVYWLQMFKDIDTGYGNKDVLVKYRMRKTSVTGNKMKVIKPQWNVLRKVEKLNLFQCLYYISCWAWISFRKYSK